MHRRADIQGLRAVAILLVVAFHLDVGFDAGYLGVDVFFVISGFVIAAMLGRELTSNERVDVRRFFARRVRRLLPALALMTVVVLAISAVVLNPHDSQLFPIRTAAAAHVFVANLYLYRHVGYFDEFAGQNPFLHTWSLSIEEQFYVAFPLVVWFAWRRRGAATATAAIAALSVASLVGWILLQRAAPDTAGLAVPDRFAFYASPTRAWQFGAGALLALQWGRVESAPRAVASAAGAVAAGILLLLVVTEPAPTVAPILIVVAAIAAIVAGAHPTPLRRALSARPMSRVGDVSYAWYLWHWPALVFAGVLAPANGWATACAVGLSFAVAVASTHLVERPIRDGRLPLGSAPGDVPPRYARAGRVAVVCTVVPLLACGGAWIGANRHWGVEIPHDWTDLPRGRQVGCTLFNRDVANTWPEDRCTTRVDDQVGTVLVLGDLHSDSVHAGVEVAATKLGLGTAVWTRDGCPMSARAPVDYPLCAEWQEAALDLVDRQRAAAVVVANQSPDYLDVDGPVAIGDRAGNAPHDRRQAARNWREGIDELVERLDRRGVPVVVVGPVPDHGIEFPRPRVSVLRPAAVPPEMTRSAAERQRSGSFGARERADLAGRGVEVVDPLPIVCADDLCPAAVGDRWWYYEAARLTARGGRALAPSIGRSLRRAIDQADA